MARRSKPVAEAVANAQAAEIISATAESMAMPSAVANTALPETPETSFNPAELEKPAARARGTRRGMIGYHFPDGGLIEVVDHGSKVGVHFDLPQGKPPESVLEAVKEDRTHGGGTKRGLSYDAREKSWMKTVSDNPVGTRLEVEARAKLAAERYLASRNLDGPSRG